MTEPALPDDPSNRREFTRVNARIDVGIYPDDRTTIIGVARDLSLSGVFIPCTGRIPHGTSCEVRLFMAGRENEEMQLSLQGKVSRVDDSGIGMQFTGVPLDGLEHLRNLIRFNAADADTVESEFDEHLGLEHKEE